MLEVSVSYFFEDMSGGANSGAGGRSALHPELMRLVSNDPTLALVRAFRRIEDEKVRTRIVSLVKALAEQDRS